MLNETLMNVSHAISVVSVSDVGLVRALNEDAVASDLTHGLVMLADGMGGYKSGEVASQMAMLVTTAAFAELLHAQGDAQALSVSEMLQKAVQRANEAIINTSQEYAACEGMGTTFVGGVFIDNTIVVGHVGDSRMYRLRGNALLQLTEDHSLLQERINAGQITQEDAKYSPDAHLVTRALGVRHDEALTLKTYSTHIEDLYLLCSDGLTDLVSDDEIKSTLIDACGDMQLAAKRLVALANACGGRDNISVLLALVNTEFSM